jgi:uncharacterized protein involved in exopolysaccharide biosynthesis
MSTEPHQPPAPPPETEGGDLINFAILRQDAGFVLRAPLRHRRLAAICFASVVVLAAASSLVIRDVYQVQAGILALRNPVMLTLSNPGLARGNDWDTPTRAARETVLRRDNLIALCNQTDLVDRYLKTRSPLGRLYRSLLDSLSGQKMTRAELTDALVDTLETKLWVNVSDEGTVTINFEWTDKDIAFQIVEAAVQNFLETRHATEIAVLGETISLLEGRAAALQKEVDSTLAQLERKERARPRVTQRRAPILPRLSPASRRDEDTARLEATLNARRRALADLEDFRQRRLSELSTLLAQKEATFAERHPEVLNTRQSIAAMSQPSPQIEALRAEVRDLERELGRRGSQAAAADVSSAATALSTDLYESRALLETDDPRYEYERGQLRFLRDQYSSVLLRLASARLELETAQAAFKYKYSVFSPPMFPKYPKRPYFLLRLLGGLLGGTALALFVTTAVDLRSGRIVEAWQIGRRLGLPLLARFAR